MQPVSGSANFFSLLFLADIFSTPPPYWLQQLLSASEGLEQLKSKKLLLIFVSV